jgi:hypothetical protein
MGDAVPWHSAMADALYGPEGFFTRAAPGGEQGSGPTGHFRTSAHASPLFATVMLRLIASVDEALGRPDPLDVVDIGAGGGHLLRRLAVLAPAYLARRIRLSAVELAPAPADLPGEIGWSAGIPAPGSLCGLVIATEWLDNVPLDVAEVGAADRGRDARGAGHRRGRRVGAAVVGRRAARARGPRRTGRLP